MKIRTRFAPSPTGDLHVGGARTALFNYLFAKSMKGKFLLRIEDTDLKRSNSSLTEKIINDIKWLNILWDEEIVFQRQNQNKHKQIIDYLLNKGLAFRCFSQKENNTETNLEKIGTQKTAFRSPWRDVSKNAQPNEQYVVRFKVPSDPFRINFTDKVRGELSWDLSTIEDFVIARSDGSSTYNLAVVVDDHNMKISHVIRGEDHLTNTVKQLLVYQALNWVTPEFAHIPLIHNERGEKLSKRDGKSSLLDFKQEGFLPDAMLNYLARLGWSYKNEEFFNLNQAISWFTLDGIGKSPSRFDIKKLLNISKRHLTSKPADEIHKLLLQYIKTYKNISLSETISEKLRQYLPLVVERCTSLGEIFESSSFFI
ncbi:glutamate--tRNA ligase [Paracoccaceae bacterium]|nr:glutamate--tRNA ligase [Paracoccaceae bacterium]